MNDYNVTGPVNLDQLADEIKAAHGWTKPSGLVLDGSTLRVIRDDADPVKVRQALDAHVPAADYGKPAEDAGLSAIRTKAQEVAAGSGTFTAAQVQKILAHLILRSTR